MIADGRFSMGMAAGVLVVEHIAAGLVENNQISGTVKVFPEIGESREALLAMPARRHRRENSGTCNFCGRRKTAFRGRVWLPGNYSRRRCGRIP